MLDAILLIVKGPPSDTSRKAGLFPVTIQHHLAIFKKVFVFSIFDRIGPRSKGARGLGDAIYLNPKIGGFSALVGARGQGKLSALAINDLLQSIKDEKIEAVTSLQSAHRAGHFAKRVASKLVAPYFLWEHSTAYEGGQLSRSRIEALRCCFGGATGVAAVSPNVLGHIENTCGFVLKNSQTIPNPVPHDFEFFRIPSGSYRESFNGGWPVFGGWTNWRPIKRLDVLLDAFDIVKQELPEARLVIAGPVDAGFKELLDRPGVTPLGNIGRAEVRQLASTVDVCCVPSDLETFGLPVIEALAEGTPVVSTNCDGLACPH